MPSEAGSQLGVCDIERIMQLLPHRYPFLLIDRIVDLKADDSCIGIKNVTANEPFFPGHFPGRPIMPGVLIVEGMAQTAAALCASTTRESEKPRLVYFMSIDRARFRKPVFPGDQLRFHMQKIQQRRSVWRFSGTALVDGTKVAEAEIGAMMMDATADV